MKLKEQRKLKLTANTKVCNSCRIELKVRLVGSNRWDSMKRGSGVEGGKGRAGLVDVYIRGWSVHILWIFTF
jgi:hypothetical protein